MFGFLQNNALKIFHSQTQKCWCYLPVKFVFFLKISLIFKGFYCFCMFVNKRFTNTGEHILKSKWCQNVKPLAYYFCIRSKISLDFHIYINIPLTANVPIIKSSQFISHVNQENSFYMKGNTEQNGLKINVPIHRSSIRCLHRLMVSAFVCCKGVEWFLYDENYYPQYV